MIIKKTMFFITFCIPMVIGCNNADMIDSIPTTVPVSVATNTPILTSTPIVNTISTPFTKSPMEQVDVSTKLQNLIIKNLGPYDSGNSTFGDIKYDERFNDAIFHEFGKVYRNHQGSKNYNPTFEFRVPANTLVISPISGIVSWFEWQPSQDDWEIHIKPTRDSEWIFGIDHVVSIDCERSANPVTVCNSPLKINGKIAVEGMSISTGDVIGYVGNWSDYDNIGINGRTELTVFKYLGAYGSDGVMNYCPTLYLSKEVENTLKSTISELMDSYEKWSTKISTYEQEKMIAPGCLYKAIKEVNGKMEPITSSADLTD
jgi:hypothetical protein